MQNLAVLLHCSCSHRTKIQLVFSSVFDAFAELDDLAVGSNQFLQFAQLCVLLLEVDVGDLDVMGQMKILGSSKKLAKSAALNYTPSLIPFIRVSGGYKEFPVLNEIRGKVSVGLGIDVFGNQFDYAYEHSDHPEYSGIHYFSLALNF